MHTLSLGMCTHATYVNANFTMTKIHVILLDILMESMETNSVFKVMIDFTPMLVVISFINLSMLIVDLFSNTLDNFYLILFKLFLIFDVFSKFAT